MNNIFDFFLNLGEHQRKMFEQLTNVHVDEFTLRLDSNNEPEIFVEGKWISIPDFIVKYHKNREELNKLKGVSK